MTVVRRLFLLPALLLTGSSLLQAAAIPNNASANLVLGQTLFTTNTSPSPATPSSLSTPGGVAVDPVTGKVFVSDQGNNRVLRYASIASLTNGATPELVFGQVNFSASAPNQGLTASQTSLWSPSGLFFDPAGRLWIADMQNSRVLMFENAAHLTSMPAYADRVYGQPDFVTTTAAPTQSKLAFPAGLCVDPAGVLWVADQGSHRVLAFKDAAMLANGAPADRVLGQTLFTTNAAAPTQTGLFSPQDVSADSTHVWVADYGNNRVVMYPNFPTINGAPASLVLGQINYITATPATSAVGLTGPTSVFASGTSLWVSDSGNNRLLRYDNTSLLGNGDPATGVVGQAGFVTSSSGVTAQKISLQFNHLWVNPAGDLWLADRLNNRVLHFNYVSPPVVPVVTSTFTLTGGKKIKTTRAVVTLRGTATASAGIRRVSYNLNDEGYVRAKGTTNWKAKIRIPLGRSKIVINSVALDGTISPPLKVIVTRK